MALQPQLSFTGTAGEACVRPRAPSLAPKPGCGGPWGREAALSTCVNRRRREGGRIQIPPVSLCGEWAVTACLSLSLSLSLSICLCLSVSRCLPPSPGPLRPTPAPTPSRAPGVKSIPHIPPSPPPLQGLTHCPHGNQTEGEEVPAWPPHQPCPASQDSSEPGGFGFTGPAPARAAWAWWGNASLRPPTGSRGKAACAQGLQ